MIIEKKRKEDKKIYVLVKINNKKEYEKKKRKSPYWNRREREKTNSVMVRVNKEMNKEGREENLRVGKD